MNYTRNYVCQEINGRGSHKTHNVACDCCSQEYCLTEFKSCPWCGVIYVAEHKEE
jgi:hypothetical protein